MVGGRLGAALAAVAMLVVPSSAAGTPARIAFDSGDDVAIVNADGSGRTTLVHMPGRVAADPSWSPDGERLALTVTESEDLLARIYVVNADGSGLRRLTPRASLATFEIAPDWSPDGSRIAFVRMKFARNGFPTSLVVVNADSSGERTVIRTHSRPLGGIDDVTWTPDGSRLAYSRSARDANDFYRPSIWSVAADGSDRRRIATDAQSPSFSPDGMRMAYVGVKPEGERQTCYEDFGCSLRGHLYVSNADGSSQRQLTSGRGDESSPAWSPDGTRILFSSDRNYPNGDDSAELYTVAPDGGCLTWVTNGTPGSNFPDWEPGAMLSSDAGGCGAIPRAPSVNVDLSQALAFTRSTVYWVGPIAPDGLLLALSDTGHEQVGLRYTDCGEFDAGACARETLELYSSRACDDTGPVLEELSGRLIMRRGALVASEPHEAAVWTGATVVDVVGRSGRDPVLAQLRPLGSDSPSAQLPPAALPNKLWHQLDRLARSKRPRMAHRARAIRSKLRRFGVRHLSC